MESSRGVSPRTAVLGIAMFQGDEPDSDRSSGNEQFAIILGFCNDHPWIGIVTHYGDESMAEIRDSYY